MGSICSKQESRRKIDPPVLEQAKPVTEEPHFPCIEVEDEDDLDQLDVDPALKMKRIYHNVYGDG